MAVDTFRVTTPQPQTTLSRFDRFYRGQLNDLNRELARLGECAESQFSEIGSHLHDFYARATEVSRHAAKTSETLIGEKPDEIRRHLQVLLSRLDQHLQQAMHRSERGHLVLADLIERLEALPDALASYRDISKTLRFLGVSTLIETSDLKSVESFQHLGEALKELERVMLTKVDRITLRLESLATLCRTVRSGVEVHDSSRLVLMGQSDALARSLLAEAGQQNLVAAEKTRSLANRSDSVASKIGEIVTSMQYHDITRQQVDHVRSALTKLGAGLGQTTDQAPLAHRAAQVKVLDEACRLQAAHLRHANEELNAAVTRIISSLRGIAETVTATAAEIQTTAGSVEREGTSVFIELDTALTNISAALARETAAGQETEHAIDTVFDAAAQMAELMEEINQIGVEMKVIALNAGISAFHSSGNCPALSVIASGIQQLAERVFLKTSSLSADFTRLIDIAGGLNSSSIPTIEHQTGQMIDLSQEASELLQRLRQLNGESVERLNGIKGLSNNLAKDIEQAISAVTVHETSRQIVGQVVHGLDEISKRAGKLPQTFNRPVDDSYLQNLREQYTMQSEREIFGTLRNQRGDEGHLAEMPFVPLDDNIEIF